MNKKLNFSFNLIKIACDIYSNLPVVEPRIMGAETVDSASEFPWMVHKNEITAKKRDFPFIKIFF